MTSPRCRKSPRRCSTGSDAADVIQDTCSNTWSSRTLSSTRRRWTCRKQWASSGSSMRELGVGLVYWPALAPLFESGEATVLELEPQTLWRKIPTSAGSAYQVNEELFDRIAALPQSKLLHGVGQPVGGLVDDPTDYVPLLRRMASRLEPAWISEHLSFNRVQHRGRVIECGFLLPPAQTHAAARVAARNIKRYASALAYPVAFETGVNYRAPPAGDLDDGRFCAELAGARRP